ncbi:type II secretion system F family protein [Agromyces sp. Marseille-P2726]|uniref:type II secretion system F family protein n=1 Tax=Agromyces sp. Marseille-P2726 TaxID=2709132 RepID=UPI0015702801|nr:type II secretion system F family protein [Agromyces sp. Marseille-P2726]
MSPGVLIIGISIALLAALVIVFFVLAPPAPRVAAERRRAPGVEYESALSKLTHRATAAVDGLTSRRSRRFFGPDELELAGVRSEPSSFVVMVASAASVLALVGVVLGLANGTSLIWGLLLALLAPIGAKALLIMRASRRRARFADQVDDTVQLLAGGLRAGHGLTRTVAAVANDAEAPTSEELARVVNETRLGRNLAESLTVAAQRMQSADFEWVAQAVAINQETGGNLAEVLDQVGKTIRQRNEIRRQVKALSAEGRLSAVVLVSLPIAVFMFLAVVQPNYVGVFFTNIFGIIALVVSLILLILGAIWVAFAVRVKF